MRKRQTELIHQMTHRELMGNLYITQIILFIAAFVIGLFTLEHISDIFTHFLWDSKWLFWGIVHGIAVVMIDILMMSVLPEKYFDDGGINHKLFKSMPVWQIPLIAFMISFSEELLFRGVIQTKFGLVAASLIFAIIHLRYWSHWYLMVNVILLSFWMGIVYEWAGQQLLPVIAMHFTIDFLLGIYIKFFLPKKIEKKGDSTNG